MKYKLAKKRIEHALKKTCPNRFTLNGKEDCFSTYINNDDGTKYLLVDKVHNDNLYCREWSKEGRSFTKEMCIGIEKTNFNNYEIVHSYKGTVTVYSGLREFTRANLIKIIFITNAKLKIYSIKQYLFNKRNILVEERVDVLRTLVNLYFERARRGAFGNNNDFTCMDYLSKKNGRFWIRHPDSSYERTRVNLLIASLHQSGDLIKATVGHGIAPQALKTLADYDEEERKHKSLIRLQLTTVLLTIVIASGTIAQAMIAYYN